MIKSFFIKLLPNRKEKEACHIFTDIEKIQNNKKNKILILEGTSTENFSKFVSYLERSYKTEKLKEKTQNRYIEIPKEDWGDYEVDEKFKHIYLTSKGVCKIKKLLSGINIDESSRGIKIGEEILEYIVQGLKAKELYIKEQEYIVRDSKIVGLDIVTKKPLKVWRYSNGMYQALMAKEQLPTEGEIEKLTIYYSE